MLSESTVQRLRALTNFPAIIGFLSRDLDWPIEAENIVEEDLDDYTFEYTPDELGIDEKYSAKITRIRQLRNLVNNQPWGIFYIEFESRRLPVTALRRVLNRLVRATEDRPGWEMEDLLFVCVQGAPSERSVAFAHFRKGDDTRLPELRTFSWDSRESHFYYIRNLNLEKLRWPEDETNFDDWRDQWRKAFTTRHREITNTAESLASAMALQAREIRELIEDLYSIENQHGYLHVLLGNFQEELFGDLTLPIFADLVAQTMTYGLFSAAAQNTNVDLDHLVEFIPKTNPFLRGFLSKLIKDRELDLYDLGIDQLINLYREANVPMIAHNFMRRSGGGDEDPIIHFYEQFLNEYDRQQRVERGVFYTPNPVVSYIVRSVDYLLKHEFGIEDGLASSAKAINPKTGKEEHTVQVLDPATGTGTFLQYIIEEIAGLKNPGGADKPDPDWNRYVTEDLLPRLNGIELMIAAHTIAHTKLALKLEQTGYKFGGDERLRVYLANALDHPRPKQRSLDIDDYLHDEYAGARATKTDRPIMVVIGNPPYSGHSANTVQDDWIGLQDYYLLGGEPLGERNPKWLQDDYVKFIRLGQNRIEETGAGVLAFITNHGYLDNPTFRGMRESLMLAFDAIYVMDLHGNANKKETAPDGGKDENVFDIRQGVAIGFFIKYPPGDERRRDMAQVYHFDLFGERESKYSQLLNPDTNITQYELIEPRLPFYLFIPQNISALIEYEKGWQITEALPTNVLGFQSHRDGFAIDFDYDTMYSRIEEMRSTDISDDDYREKYGLRDNRDWQLSSARTVLREDKKWKEKLIRCNYRPLDQRYCYFSEVTMDYPRRELLDHVAGKDNLCLNTMRQTKMDNWQHALVSANPAPAVYVEIKDGSSIFPLYLYRLKPNEDREKSEEPATQQLSLGQIEDVYPYTSYDDDWERRPNLHPDFVSDVELRLGLQFLSDGRGDLVSNFGPEDLFHYIYAIFYSTKYRNRYSEFLKIDFPRLPITDDLVLFNKLVQKGADLVALHLLEDDYPAAAWKLDGDESPIQDHGVEFHEADDLRIVGKFSTRNYVAPKDDAKGRIYLHSSKKDDISYFEGIEPEVWEFEVGGYQVLYKWLYDRRTTGSQDGRQLTDEDIEHYKRIVASLRMTIDIMRDIDIIIDEHGGWPLRGSQPDETTEEEDMADEKFPKSEKDMFGRRTDQLALGDMRGSNPSYDEDETPPDELTSSMIEEDLQRRAGVEAEIDDSEQRLSTETDEDLSEDIQPFDPTKINIIPRTLSVGQMMQKIEDFEASDGEIGMNLRPDFQRMGGIWNDEKQSRLMESMMIRIPLPAFYMNESAGNEDLWLVIDGLQRLTAMRRFLLDKTLRLKKLEFWKEYEGCKFDDLPLTLRRRIEETNVNIYLVKEGTPHNVKFNIFKRINTGGAPLSGQEIRHALNQGPATDLLAEFAMSPEFKRATDEGVSPMRMTDRECVLRFLAFMHKDDELRDLGMRDEPDYDRRDELDSFLNDQLKALNTYLGNRKNPNEERWQSLKTRFNRVMTASREIFENRAFRKPNDSNRRSPVSKALFEVWAVNLDLCTDDELATLVTRGEELEAAFSELMDDTDFVISISYSTGNEKRVHYRHDRIRHIIQKTLNGATD